MRRYSPEYYSPPRRGYGGGGGGRGRSPPRKRREQNNGSLLVRNIPLDCRPEELRVPFERFGLVRDVYIPKDYYTGGLRENCSTGTGSPVYKVGAIVGLDQYVNYFKIQLWRAHVDSLTPTIVDMLSEKAKVNQSRS